MPETNIGSTVNTDMSNNLVDFSVNPQTTDGISSSGETTWVNDKWSQYLGYYKTIPELNSTIDARATWTVGKGFTADETTSMILDQIKGYGIDTFNNILENMIRDMFIGGDAFAEIMTDDKGILLNLKVLDPSSVMIVVDDKGMIKRYEQISKVKKPNKKFNTDEIFHLCRNRVADEIHGVSVIEKLEQIILMRNETMQDMKILMHRNVVPQVIWHVDTDDPTKVAAFKAKVDSMVTDRENIIIPKGAVEREVAGVAPNATLNGLPWIDSLNDYFYEACATPKIIVGNSKNFTEASAKIVYLAFQQSVEEDQLYIEEQVLSQLNLEINLEFPASLENEVLSDKPKEGEEGASIEQPEIEQEQAFEPNDTTAEMEGNR